MRALPSWVFASFVAAATAACSLSLGSDSAGENGVMRFEYQSSQCTFGCDLERPALEGSAVSIAAKGGDVDSHFNFVFEPSDLAAVQEQTESCSCSQRWYSLFSSWSRTTRSTRAPRSRRRCSAFS